MPIKDVITYHPSHGLIIVRTKWTGTSEVPPGEILELQSRSVGPYMRQRRDWRRTPGFAEKVKTGAPLPANSFQYTESKGRVTLSGLRVDKSFNPYQGHVTVVTSYGGIPLNWSERDLVRDLQTDDHLYIEAAGKIKSDKTWDVALFAAELGKSVALLVDVGTRTATALAHAKKLRLGDMLDVLFPKPSPARDKKWEKAKKLFSEDVANTLYPKRYGVRWEKASANELLAFRYGIMPMMKDLQDAVAAIEEIATQKLGNTQSIYVARKRSDVFNESIPILTDPEDVEATMSLACTDSRRLHINYEVVDAAKYYASRLGITNPLSTAYNLIPFSFVADWFGNIGDWLSSLDAGVGVKFHDCWIGRRKYAEASFGGASSSYFRDSIFLSGSASHLHVTRTPLPGLPIAMPTGITWKPGLLNQGGVSGTPTLSGSHITSALALLRQLVK